MVEKKDIENIGIGTIEGAKCIPGTYTITGYGVVKVPSIGDKIVFYYDIKGEQHKISNVTVLKNKKITPSGTWFNLDEERNILKSSALAYFLSFLGATTLKETIGKQIEVVEDDKGYGTIKAY